MSVTLLAADATIHLHKGDLPEGLDRARLDLLGYEDPDIFSHSA